MPGTQIIKKRLSIDARLLAGPNGAKIFFPFFS
jgi:hypothetical protein